MINASQEFKKLINSGAKVVNYADVTLRDGTVLNLTPEDFILGGFSMVDEITDGKFGVGFAIGKTINVTIANHTNKFSNYDFYNSIIYMYVAIHTEDGRVLKERKGKYYVINPTSPGEVIKLSGVDSMYLLDKPYNAKTAYPATLQTILSDCCIDCGINIGFRQFDKYNFVVSNKPEDVTYRDVVSYVAQIAGYNARISNNDALELIWYDTTFMGMDVLDGGNLYSCTESDTYDGGDFSNYEATILFDGGNFTDASPENVTKVKSLSVSTDEIIITGIVVENENTRKSKGTEDYVIKVKDNPLTVGKENEILSHLYNKLVGYEFRALDCKIVNNPLFEPFDACYIYDRKGNFYFTLINSVKYKIGGFTTISCKADDPVRNESSYTSEAAKAEVRAKRKASELALKAYEDAKKHSDNQLTIYDYAVQNMNMLAANAMGLYRESEKQSDGSEIYYQSNRPITKNSSGKCQFETGSVVYKMTGNGFFVSTNGGKSFTSGFDSNGNAILNVLSAIGITFDWARGGTLSLGGDNNVDGELVVKNASGDIIGKLNKDGLWSSNGYFKGKVEADSGYFKGKVEADSGYFKGTIESKNAAITGGYIDIETSYAQNSEIILRSPSGSIYIRPIGINFYNAYDFGTQIRDDYLMVAGSSSRYSKIERGRIIVSDDSSYIEITDNSYRQTSGNFSVSGDFSVSSLNLKINSDYFSDYCIKAEKGIKVSGDSIFGAVEATKIKASSEISASGDLKIEGNSTFSKKANLNGGLGIPSGYGVSFSVGCDAKFDGNVNLNGNCVFGNSITNRIGFFGNSGSSKQSVSKIYSTSSADASDCASKINEIINALNKYNLL